jgi:hypothetical protein
MIIAKNLSGADIGWAFVDVSFIPKSGHRLSALGCLLCANSGHGVVGV